MPSEDAAETPAFACCSVGIGRWFWVAWESEAEAKSLSPPLASGYEASADRAEAKAAERLGSAVRRLPAKWASAYKRGGRPEAQVTRAKREVGGGEGKPRSRFGRRGDRPDRPAAAPRLAFLYCVIEREPPDPSDPVAVTRHRIVKQTTTKIHVERDPFDEDEWARRSEEAADGALKPPTIAVDRAALRIEGRFRCGRTHTGLTFYSSEDAGIRDVEADLTARHAWCATLGLRFPLSTSSIKAAYRRLAMTAHPDAGGDAAEFRAIEQAYREALAYLQAGR